MSRLPYEDLRIIEQSATLTGRLAGLLFADQGAEVYVERRASAAPVSTMPISIAARSRYRRAALPTLRRPTWSSSMGPLP